MQSKLPGTIRVCFDSLGMETNIPDWHRKSLLVPSWHEGDFPTIMADSFTNHTCIRAWLIRNFLSSQTARILLGYALALTMILLFTTFLFAQEPGAITIPPFETGSQAKKTGRGKENIGWSERFESTGVSWRYLYRKNNVEVVDHQRTSENSYTGSRSERLTVRFSEKGYLVLGHYLDYPIAIDDVGPSLWLCADRPGIAFGVLVVFPRSLRPDTGKPVTLLVPAKKYTKIGSWERMAFESGFRKPFQRMVQSARSEQKINIDTTEAYIRQIVLLAEGTGGQCTLYVDDIECAEHLPASYEVLKRSEQAAQFNPVNLLAFRLTFSEVPVFPDTQYSTSYYLGKEPFGLQKKEETRISPYSRQAPQYSFDQFRDNMYAATFPDTDPEHFRFRDWESQAGEPASGIGQVGYHATNANGKSDRVLAVNYSQPGQDGNSGIISGSGTLQTSSEAVAYSSMTTAKPSVGVIQFNGSVLSVGDIPSYGIRAIEYQNEPLMFLKEQGFNAVWVKRAPSAALLEEAKTVDIWLIVRPPVGQETVSSQTGFGQAPAPVAAPAGVQPYFNRTSISADYDKVLLWDMGGAYRRSDVDLVRAASRFVKTLDSHNRPVICHVDSGVSEITSGNEINAILIKRQPLLTSLDLNDYAKWLADYPRIGMPSAAYWNEIQTQPDIQLLAQCRFFGAVDEMPSLITYEQMRQQVRLSMAAGCHGLLFASNSPLNATDHETQYRATALNLINLELQLTEPWFSNGIPEEILPSNKPGISAIIQKTARTGLLLPISTERDNQYAMGQAAAENVTLIAPVREGYTADYLVPGSLRQVPSSRKAGGVWLALDDIGMNSLVFLTQSEWYNQVMAKSAPMFGEPMARQAILLTRMRLDTFEKTLAQLLYLKENELIPSGSSRPLLEISEQDTLLAQTKRSIAQSQTYFENKDYSQAYLEAERAGREIRMRERQFWESATRNELNRPVLPVSVAFSMLPAYLESYRKINSGSIRFEGGNRIIGGDMESVQAWSAGKWIRYELPTHGVKSGVSCDSVSAHTGASGMRLHVSKAGEQFPFAMEQSPIWMEIPISVQTGELICVQGWIRIPNDLTNTVDGLTVSEDHGGPALGLRFKKATPWR
ncbi:MAG: hypothetical protein PHQ75_05180, partial [Thermoguttaceae bacterium]|nr:hypothetical protein [Thermoguttaceae bacterium]